MASASARSASLSEALMIEETQSASALARVGLGNASQERLERALQLGEVAFGQPVLEQVVANRNSNLGRTVVLEAELECRPEVCAFGAEATESLDLAPVMCPSDGSQVRHPGEMATTEQERRLIREVLPT